MFNKGDRVRLKRVFFNGPDYASTTDGYDMRLAREWELGQTATVLRYDSDRMVLRFDHLPAYNSSTWDNPEKWFELEESLDPKLPDWF